MMEIARPVPPPEMTDFQFDSTCSSPFTTAPSILDPRALGVGLFYFSAPTSPNRAQYAVVPYQWQLDSAGKHKDGVTDQEVSDEFEFSARFSEKSSVSTADELFHDGKILPLKLPPRLQSPKVGSVPLSPKSPRSPVEQGKRLLRGAFSRPARDFDPFAVALEETRIAEIRREREAAAKPGKRSRSLSPLRTDSFTSASLPSEEEMQNGKPSSAAGSKGSRKKWRLKDFLFRSASEGREKKTDGDNASFQSTESGGSGSLRGGHRRPRTNFSTRLTEPCPKSYRSGRFCSTEGVR